MNQQIQRLLETIRDVPDFPKPGIVFKDITPLLADPETFGLAIDQMVEAYRDHDVDKILAIESRGFLFGAPLATALGAGLVPARKQGKLPWQRHRVEYALEYGTDAIEIHRDAIAAGERVLIVDDVLATGGTARAAADIVTQSEGDLVGMVFLIELAFLNGRTKLDGIPVWSLLTYE